MSLKEKMHWGGIDNGYLTGGLGTIDYTTYSEIYDFAIELLGKMYEQGLKDCEKKKSY